jgi:hypothetical protein
MLKTAGIVPEKDETLLEDQCWKNPSERSPRPLNALGVGPIEVWTWPVTHRNAPKSKIIDAGK